jgi:ribosomal protein S18 acetylase RimI-like enzyme
MELFTRTPGITVREADSKSATEKYLQRNPGLSFVAVEANQIIGCVMSGHDGRRAYLQHLVVDEQYRNKGIGEHLFKLCIDALQKVGIEKTHIFVFKDNDIANSFWPKRGWQIRNDLNMYSYTVCSNPNA